MTTGAILSKQVSRRLIKALEEAGSERALSRKLDLNISYVSQLLKDGTEPTDKTEKGRAARVKLFLPRKKPKPRIVKERPAAPSQEWWERVAKQGVRVMVKLMKESVLRQS